MESVQAILGKGFGVAARLGYRVFRTAVFNALFMLSEEDLELGIEEKVDLLGLFLIYAPQHVRIVRQFVGRTGKGFEKKITLANSLRWVKEECDRKKTHHYDVIVNLPPLEPGSNPGEVAGSNPAAPVYPPPGADMKRVNWFWKQCQNLMNYAFYGKVSQATKKWGVEHLKWLAARQKEGKTEMSDLLAEGHKQARESKTK